MTSTSQTRKSQEVQENACTFIVPPEEKGKRSTREAEFIVNNSRKIANNTTVREAPTLDVIRSKHICLEFGHTDVGLSEAFPWLFPLGIPNINRQAAFERHLLRYWDHRFEDAPMLLFYLFNMRRRHAVTQKVAKTPDDQAAKFDERISDANFLVHLEDALQKTKSSKQEELTELEAEAMSFVSEIIKITTGALPFSVADAKRNQLHLHSLFRAFDLPLFFVTFSPCPGEVDVGLSLCIKTVTSSDTIAIPYTERMRYVYSRPASSARFFELMLGAFLEIFLGVAKTSTKQMPKNPEGVFGKCDAYHVTVECQS